LAKIIGYGAGKLQGKLTEMEDDPGVRFLRIAMPLQTQFHQM
jgi:hypothetical protein